MKRRRPWWPGGGSRRLPKLNREALPLIRLNHLDVGVESLRYQEGSAGVPLELALRLMGNGPITLLAPEPVGLDPIQLRVEGAALPLVESIESDISLSPFAVDPNLEVGLLISGIRGDQVVGVLPALEGKLDASAWTAGRVGAHLSAQLAVRRRSALDFPLQDGFGLELVVDQVSVQAHPEAEASVGFEELSAQVASIRPLSGDVHVRQVEWVNPFFSARKDELGLHFADLVWKGEEPVEPGEPEESGELEELAEVPLAPETPVVEEPAGGELPGEVAAGGEVKVDEVLISGGRFSYEDHTVEPAMVFPVADMEFEAKRFSTRTLTEERPFRFQLQLFGGQVELPERVVSGNLVSGLLGSVTALATGKGDFEVENRSVFDEFSVRGNLSLGPQPKGWVQLRVRALELPIFRGLASQSGVDIGDDLLDESARVQLDGQGNLRLSAATKFSYLSLSEPPGGPISSYLKLPAPLDTVLFVLKDEDGDQAIPLNVSVSDGGASTSQVLGAVTKALGLLIGEAIASSPMRVASGVVDFIGLGSKPLELDGSEWVQWEYLPGELQVPSDWSQRIEPLVDLLRRDPSLYLVVEQGLGQLDVDHAAVLANPDPEECFALAAAYRRERGQGIAERDRIADAVRLAYALGKTDQAQDRSLELRLKDAELARTEAALDRVLERSQDQGERAAKRHTKSAALELIRRRQTIFGEKLNRLAVAGMQTRLDLRRPRFQIQEEAERSFVLIAVKRRR